MALKEHIGDIRDALRRKQFTSEALVSQGIVRRLLDALDWPKYDPQIVIPEYPVPGGRVDFALCHPALKPMVFIEVKQVGQSDGAERQLFEYAFHAGVPIAVLTDGQKWQFFHPIGRGNYEERRVYTLDIIETDSEESVSHLNRYLNYESVCTGEAAKAIADDYRNASNQRLIEENLPESWNKLIEEKDEILLELVAEKVESLCGQKPTDNQVWDFLESLKKRRASEKFPSLTPKSASPKLGEASKRGRKKGPQGNNQLEAYIIPVIQLMKNKSHTEAFKCVAEELDVQDSTARSVCTRGLGINIEEFKEHVKSGQIIQIIKDKYPEHRELITRELGGSVRQSI